VIRSVSSSKIFAASDFFYFCLGCGRDGRGGLAGWVALPAWTASGLDRIGESGGLQLAQSPEGRGEGSREQIR